MESYHDSNQKIFKNKRILIFLRSFDIGGAERQAALLANFLAEKGAKVSVWAYSKKGPICDLLDENVSTKSIGFNLDHQRPENLWKRKIDLFSLALKIALLRPHVIMPFTVTPNVDCGYIWKWTGAKACVWNQRDEWLNFLDKDIERKAFDRTPLFVANSTKGKELIESELKERKAPVFHIPNAVILGKPLKSEQEWKDNLKISEDTFVAIMIANLHENKDHETLLKAWKLIVDEFPNRNPTLLLAGRPDSTQEKLMQLCRELGIVDYVKILGFVSDISGLLRISDIGVFSSRKEGCPNGVLECMAASLPVIATDIDGTRDALGRDYELFVSVGDVDDFYQKIKELIGNSEKRKRIGERNKERIEAAFSPKATFGKYLEILERYP